MYVRHTFKWFFIFLHVWVHASLFANVILWVYSHHSIQPGRNIRSDATISFCQGLFFYLLRSKLGKISEEKPLTYEDVVQPTNHQTKRTTCLKYFLFTEYRSRLNKKRKFEIGKIQSWTFQYILLMPLQKCHLKETPQPFA